MCDNLYLCQSQSRCAVLLHMGVLRASVFGWFVLTVMGCTSAPAPSTPPAAPVSSSAPFDVSAVIRQVQRSFREDGARWTTAGTGWALRTSEEGLELTAIHRPDAPLSLGLVGPQRRVESGAIRLGPTRLERGGWKQTTEGLKPERAHDGTLHLTGDGFVERLENAEVGLEQSWHFESAPGTDGDLVLTIPVTGATHRGTTATGEHLVDATSGLGFRVGHGTFVDAAGVETPVPVSFEAGVLVLRVPETVLDRALFPAVLDPVISPEFDLEQPVRHPTSAYQQEAPAVASNGSIYLLVWAQGWPTQEVYAVRLSPSGLLLDPGPLVLSAVNRYEDWAEKPTVASNGTDFLVAWSRRWPGIEAIRLSANGTVLDQAPLLIAGDRIGFFNTLAIASNGSDYLIAWSGSPAAECARVTSSGVLLDPGGLPLAQPTSGGEGRIGIAGDNDGYVVAWMEYGSSTEPEQPTTIRATGVRPDGGLSSDGGFLIASGSWTTAPSDPWVFRSGSSFQAFWHRGAHSSASLEGAPLLSSGQRVGPPSQGSSSGWCGHQLHAVGSGPDQVAVWLDCSGNVRAGSIAADASVQVAPVIIGDSYKPASVATLGGSALVSWLTNSGTIMARILDGTGNPLDAGFAVGQLPTLQILPSVASIGDESLVVWSDQRDGHLESAYDIFGARVARDGGLLDPTGFPISRAVDAQIFGTVATDGTGYFVAWLDFRDGIHSSNIYGTRVTRSGVVLDFDGGIRFTPSGGPYHMPRVASNGAQYLVVWSTAGYGTTGVVLASRVSASGTILDPQNLILGSPVSSGEMPGVATDGTDYFIVWSGPTSDGGMGVSGSRITASGQILDPTGLLIANGPLDEVGPTIASNGRSYFVAWEEHSRQWAWRYRRYPYDLWVESERIRGTLVSQTGVVLDAGPLLLSPATGDRSATTVGSNGSDYLVAWQDRRSGNFDIYGARITGDGVLQDDGGFLLAGSYANEALPALSSLGGGDYLLAYNQHYFTEHPRRIKARFVDFNGPPVPRNLALTTAEDAALSVTLAATDPENEPLTFSIRRAPAHGRLAGMPPQLVYTPDADFSGIDTFEYRANDGQSTSRPGLVTVTVTPFNDAPVVQDTSLTFLQGQPISLLLSARDADGDVLQYTLLASPAVGLLMGRIPNFTWQPPAGFRGATSLRFRVSDGTDAREGTVRWTVTNVAPTVTASASATMTTEGERLQFFASASDPGQDALEFSWDFGDGTRSDDTAPFHVFERTGRFRVTVTASDGLAQASSFVDVDVGNGAPRLTVSLPVTADEGAPISMRADVRDSQATAATVTWDFGDGTPTAQGESVTHVFPDDGRFSVTVTATDAQGASRQVVREVTVFNVAPTPAAQALLSVTPGTRVMTTLSATDPAGARDPLSWTLLQGPGALSANGQYTWEPRADEVGRFSIEARVTDDDTGAAIVRFDVQVVSPAAPMGCSCMSISPGPFLLALVALVFTRRRRIG